MYTGNFAVFAISSPGKSCGLSGKLLPQDGGQSEIQLCELPYAYMDSQRRREKEERGSRGSDI